MRKRAYCSGPNAEELIEVMADVANSQSFLKLHYFSAEAKDPIMEIYSLRNKALTLAR